jgi:hypothetical protein
MSQSSVSFVFRGEASPLREASRRIDDIDLAERAEEMVALVMTARPSYTAVSPNERLRSIS